MVRKLSVAAILLLGASSAVALTPSGFVFFGDSFIDAGAVHQFSGGTIAPAALGFFQGRFSDGPTWADYLGLKNGGLVPTFYTGNPPGTIPGQPGFVFTPGATNFAVGGARAGSDDGLIPGLASQFGLYSLYLAATGDLPDANTLFVLNFGNNDVNYIDSLAGNPVAQAIAANQYVFTMTQVVAALSNNGIRNVLVAGVPNPTNPTGVALQDALDSSLNGLAPLLQMNETTLFRFDYFDFFNDLRANPVRFGLPATLITDRDRFCLGELPPGSDCSNYLLFDGIHVTAGVQRALSIRIANQLGLAAVPEPATWAMMIAGFGLVGAAMRRRRAEAPREHAA